MIANAEAFRGLFDWLWEYFEKDLLYVLVLVYLNSNEMIFRVCFFKSFRGRVLLVSIFFFIVLPDSLFAQISGIDFKNYKCWSDLVQIAKQQNKFIFVDCFATWCIPCKQMERVFVEAGVGEYMNENFEAVKVQFDTTKFDNVEIKNWYNDSHYMDLEYNVQRFPTYLFFSPDGRILDKGVGLLSDSDFLLLAQRAKDSSSSYFNLVRLFDSGHLSVDLMPRLASIAYNNDDQKLAENAARKYLVGYLDKKGDLDLQDSSSVAFYKSFLGSILSTKDSVFYWLCKRGRQVDSLIGYQGFSESVINLAIERDLIDPVVFPNGKAALRKPNWGYLTRVTKRMFGRHYSDWNVLAAKIRWSRERGNWPDVAKYSVEKIDRFGLKIDGINWVFVNNTLYDVVFKHSNSFRDLKKAAIWSSMIVDLEPNSGSCIDTYANLLYKCGERDSALNWERKAMMLKPNDLNIKNCVYKMEHFIPTW